MNRDTYFLNMKIYSILRGIIILFHNDEMGHLADDVGILSNSATLRPLGACASSLDAEDGAWIRSLS